MKSSEAGDREHTETTARLLVRVREGDDRARERLIGRHADSLHRWARGRLPRWARELGDTADLVQDTLLGAFRRLDHFESRGAGALRAYLRQAVVNRIRDAIRRSQRRPGTTDLDDSLADGGSPSPLEQAMGREVAERYRSALLNLTRTEQRAVVARVEMRYSYDQIALLLGKPSSDAARMTVRRALQRLAESMALGS